MAVIKPSGLEQYLGAGAAGIRAFLAFGSDPGGAHDAARLIVRQFTGSSDDPMSVVHLTEPALKDDPGRLADEAGAISMFGGPRAIWLRDPGNAALKALSSFLEDLPGDARIVVEAGNLAKSSALRKLFETAKAAATVPCYADTVHDLHELAASVLSRAGLRISTEARVLLVSLLGNDRALSRSELDKLALYCHGRDAVEVEDIIAICGDAAAQSTDSLTDAAFEGDAAAASRQFAMLIEGSASTSGLLTALARHITMLEALRLSIDGGKPADTAVKGARPPVFFKRQPSVTRQLRLWSLPSLQRARKTIFDTTLRCREMPALEIELTERCILSLARNSQAARQA